ncbi:M48 family metalloprotease [Nocardia takedensis]|uniref:M48 family metalloprotease n=1 Tax=Nocardia takedensis TaxID=259390 RepID=UPI0002E130EF|nr:M48 family metalloprotease [Nocardia takedensis]
MTSPAERGRADAGTVYERVIGTGTSVRFALLVVLSLVTAAAIVGERSTDPSYLCLLAAGGDPDHSILHNFLVMQTQSAAYTACEARLTHRLLPWWAAPVAPIALALVAVGLFLVLGPWKVRRRKLVPLDRIDADGLLGAQLRDLVAVAGLRRVPRFVIDARRPTTGAVVFGRTRAPVVCLHGGLVASRYANPRHFRTVVLHELAHVRNGDVTLTYLTVAVWRVFLIVFLLPYIVWHLLGVFQDQQYRSDFVFSLRNVAFTLVLVLAVYLARSDLLRRREIQADRTAASYDPGGWEWAVADPPARPGRARAVWHAFGDLWRAHPRWERRRRALRDTRAPFAVGRLSMFLTGLAGGLLAAQASAVGVRVPGADSAAAPLATALAALLVTAVAGRMLWRATLFAALAGGAPPARFVPGLLVGCGSIVAELLVNRAAIGEWVPRAPAVLALALIVGAIYSWWIVECTVLWTAGGAPRRLRMAEYLVLGGAFVGLATWLSWWGASGTMHLVGWPMSAAAYLDARFGATPLPDEVEIAVQALFHLSGFESANLAAVAICAVTVIPLAATILRRSRGAPGAGALSRSVLTVGLLGGAVTVTATVFALRDLYRLDPLPPPLAVSWMFFGRLTAAVVAGALCAAIAINLRPRPFRLTATLVAAQIALLAGGAVTLSAAGSATCLPLVRGPAAAACAWRSAAPMLVLTMSVAVVTVSLGLAATVAMAFAGLDALRRTSAVSAAPASRGRSRSGPRTRRAAALALCAAILTFAVLRPLALAEPTSGDAESSTPIMKAPDAVDSSSFIRMRQVQAWNAAGGADLVSRALAEYDAMVAIVGRAAESDDPEFWARELARMGGMCANLRAVRAEAGRYFAIPDAAADASWARFLDRVDGIAAHCMDLASRLDRRPPGDPDETLLRALAVEVPDEFTAAGQDMIAAMARITVVLGG